MINGILAFRFIKRQWSYAATWIRRWNHGICKSLSKSMILFFIFGPFQPVLPSPHPFPDAQLASFTI